MPEKKQNQQENNNSLPISTRNLIRLLTAIIIILSFLAGYYQALYKMEIRRYKRLENNYVRIRQELGVEKTQELIDQSYEKEESL